MERSAPEVIMSTRNWCLVAAAAAVAGMGISVPAMAAEADASESAVWMPKETQFTYLGFTTRYSCEGLASQVRSVLLSLGARREDLKVHETGCAASAGRPTPFPGVKVRMSVLVPATAAAGTDVVPAHWKPVKVQLDSDPLREAGECELVEQISQKLLPLFSVRNVEFKPNCVPHQLDPGGTRLQAQVLLPDPADPADRQAAAAPSR